MIFRSFWHLLAWAALIVVFEMASAESSYTVTEQSAGPHAGFQISGPNNYEFNFVTNNSGERFISSEILPVDSLPGPIVWTEWAAGPVTIARVFNLNCRRHELVFEGQSSGFVSKETSVDAAQTVKGWIVTTVYTKLDGYPDEDRTLVPFSTTACDTLKPANALPLNPPNY
jgi:hypothetical protein